MSKRHPEQMSVKEVAAMHDVHSTTVVRWITDGKLKARRRAGRQYVIERRDAEAILVPVEPVRLLTPAARQAREAAQAEAELRRQGFQF